MKVLLHALCTALLLAACSAGLAAEASPQTVLHLLDYVAVEYPQFVKNGRATNAEEYAEQVEFSGQIERAISALPARPQQRNMRSKPHSCAWRSKPRPMEHRSAPLRRNCSVP
jgi:high-affinity iron transporter